MCEAAPTQFYKLPKQAIIGDRDSIVSPKATLGAGGYDESLVRNGDTNYSKLDENVTPTRSSFIQGYSGYIDMLKPPEIMKSLNTKLHIDSELKERLKNERHIKYAINNIYNIIGDLLQDPGFNYKINVVLRDAGDIHGWEHIDIIIKFPDEHYDDITGYWKSISTKVSNLYKSLPKNPEYSEEIVKRIRKFIYIIVISEA